VIFAVLVSLAHVSGIFGIFIPAWILYQSFEAFHTAKALRDGLPVPDPLGLNDIGNWLNLGKHPQYPGQPPMGQPPMGQPPVGQPGAQPGPAQPNRDPWTASATQPPPASGAWQAPYSGGAYQPPYQPSNQGQWQNPYAPPPPGPMDPNVPPPPIPPDPSSYGGGPAFWHRGAPVGAVVLIALGTLFLLGQLDIFHGRLIEFTWPVFLIGLGVWLVVRRLGESQGGPK